MHGPGSPFDTSLRLSCKFGGYQSAAIGSAFRKAASLHADMPAKSHAGSCLDSRRSLLPAAVILLDLVRVLDGLDTNAAPIAESTPKQCTAAVIVVATPGG